MITITCYNVDLMLQNNQNQNELYLCL